MSNELRLLVLTAVLFSPRATAETDVPLANAITQAQQLHRSGDLNGALDVLEEGLALSQAAPEQHRAAALNELGTVYADMGRPLAAIRLLKQAAAVWQRIDGPDSIQSEMPLINLARAYVLQRRSAEGQRILERLLVLRQARHGEYAPETAVLWASLADLHYSRGCFADAERCSRSALNAAYTGGREQPMVAASARRVLALLQLRQGRSESALIELERALREMQQAVDSTHPSILLYLVQIAYVRIQLRELATAEELLVRALAIADARLPRNHVRRAQTLQLLSTVYRRTARKAQAKVLEEAASVALRAYRDDNLHTHTVDINELGQTR